VVRSTLASEELLLEESRNSEFSCVKLSKPPWFNKELTHLRNVKSRLYTKFKNTGSQSILCKYLSTRFNFPVLNAQCYKNYLNRCRFQFAQDPNQFHNFVSTKR